MLEPLKDPKSQLELAAVLEMQGNRSGALKILLDLERTQTLGDKGERSIVRLLLADRRYEEAADRLVELMRKAPNDRQLDREFLDAVAASDHWSDPVRQAVGDVYRHSQESGFEPLDAEGFVRFGDALRPAGPV